MKSKIVAPKNNIFSYYYLLIPGPGFFSLSLSQSFGNQFCRCQNENPKPEEKKNISSGIVALIRVYSLSSLTRPPSSVHIYGLHCPIIRPHLQFSFSPPPSHIYGLHCPVLRLTSAQQFLSRWQRAFIAAISFASASVGASPCPYWIPPTAQSCHLTYA